MGKTVPKSQNRLNGNRKKVSNLDFRFSTDYGGVKMKGVSTIIAVFIFSISMVPPVWAEENPFLDAGFIPVKDKIASLDFTMEDLEGSQVEMTDFRGNVVLVFFWTTW